MKTYDLVIYGQALGGRLITLDELGRLVGRHPAILRRYIKYGLIDPTVEQPEPLFEDTTVEKVLKIERLKKDLELNSAACGLVLELLEKISDLETELSRIRMSGG